LIWFADLEQRLCSLRPVAFGHFDVDLDESAFDFRLMNWKGDDASY